MEITQEFSDFLLFNIRDIVQVMGYFMCYGFALATFLSLLGYGIFKAASLVNIAMK